MTLDPPAAPFKYIAISTACWNQNVREVLYTTASAPSAGGAGTGASAVGDPHLQNIHGERFDLMKEGRHVLISIPRGKEAQQALLRVQADARRLGGQCADMYFQELNVTGSWAEAKQAGGYHYSVVQGAVEAPEWVAFGKVELKVARGHTLGGVAYLNVLLRNLKNVAMPIGGLLGEDSHELESKPSDSCKKTISLIQVGDAQSKMRSEAKAYMVDAV